MTERHLTITLQPDWKAAIRAAGVNFETPAQFFGKLSDKRWGIVRAAQGKGEMSVRKLARLVNRDVKRVHDDIVVLAELGLLERTEGGGVTCPYHLMHIDMLLQAA
jgi:predicted transcriptional regulator